MSRVLTPAEAMLAVIAETYGQHLRARRADRQMPALRESSITADVHHALLIGPSAMGLDWLPAHLVHDGLEDGETNMRPDEVAAQVAARGIYEHGIYYVGALWEVLHQLYAWEDPARDRQAMREIMRTVRTRHLDEWDDICRRRYGMQRSMEHLADVVGALGLDGRENTDDAAVEVSVGLISAAAYACLTIATLTIQTPYLHGVFESTSHLFED